jgi:hypothetical protein
MTQFSTAVEWQKLDISVLLRCIERDMQDAVKKYEELKASPNFKDTSVDRDAIREALEKINELAKKLPQ